MASNTMASPAARKATTSLDSTFPVLLPVMEELRLPSHELYKCIEAFFPDGPSTTTVEKVTPPLPTEDASTGSNFMDALRTEFIKSNDEELAKRNLTRTDNKAMVYNSTNSPLVDLFNDLGTAKGTDLQKLLDDAWAEDAPATLKLIWNARSIHLGKGSQRTFYQCLGWLKPKHPKTLLTNLQWLNRPCIEKKKREEQAKDDDDMQLIDEDGQDVEVHDIEYGASHGYWKDLLNILVLEITNTLDVHDARSALHPEGLRHKFCNRRKRRRDTVDADVSEASDADKSDADDSSSASSISVKRKIVATLLPKTAVSKTEQVGETFTTEKTEGLNKMPEAETPEIEEPSRNDLQMMQQQRGKLIKHKLERKRHGIVVSRLEDDRFYRALHLVVARLFADQLERDIAILNKPGASGKEVSKISLCAKWAPSLEGTHDKHTNIATSIAEIMYPSSSIDEPDRETYLRKAREAYRGKVLSPLRKALSIVERDITAKSFDKIQYERVPSKAMDTYKTLFAEKDGENFEKYLVKVAAGKARISGAVLTPAKLVKQCMMPASKIAEKVMDLQWKALVQRIKDNGSLSSSIAVCDVSGSMQYDDIGDGTTPIHSSVGLSLLIAEIVEPPFGGTFITFSEKPGLVQAGGANDARSFKEKIVSMYASDWGANTDFLAVFERLLLPLALEHKLRPEEMVRQVFVFSDMQFDAADRGVASDRRWNETVHLRIKRKFAEHGYALPTMVYWNLAAPGGSRGKLATRDMPGVVMVSGYSQAMVKMFLENGQFPADGEGEVVVDVKEEPGADGLVLVTKTKTKAQITPEEGMRKAIGHVAYSMLKVVD